MLPSEMEGPVVEQGSHKDYNEVSALARGYILISFHSFEASSDCMLHAPLFLQIPTCTSDLQFLLFYLGQKLRVLHADFNTWIILRGSGEILPAVALAMTEVRAGETSVSSSPQDVECQL